jgi:hypothetical protein
VKRDETSKPLDRFRRRADRDPFFLGHALGRFASERGFGDSELAGFLGCGIERLPHLMACRSPDPEVHRFAADVRKITEFAGCNEDRLLLALRELSVLGVLRVLPAATQDGPTQSGLLAARVDRAKRSGKTERGHDHD